MELKRADVHGRDVLTVPEYVEKYGNGIKPQSLYYAMDNDLVDWVSFGGREKYLVMTDKTRAYTPNESKKRTKPTVMSL